MAQLGFLLDQRYCIGCQGCETACQARNEAPIGISLRTADSFEYKESAPFLTVSCSHCEEPACVATCPVKAITKNPENGIVKTDYAICIGCKACIAVCPYGAPKYSEDKKVSMKCDFCADRQAAGENPACIDGCPVKVLTFGELESLGGEKSTEEFEYSEKTKPAFRFIKK
ncbi:hypothetical protein AN640_08830 [Candidatus Epulonipiscium fishelsonii]|uniref:Uncharacterized protein n=1 Tax=Candidatus Epulonipiscium fishelsonii TaxID=77094 RepID=A0ACC8XCC1_9FIRM|nr:hypothetical protein AN640_08830 [Epulopiscium sp. SCG-D08WGA-EpuloA1]